MVDPSPSLDAEMITRAQDAMGDENDTPWYVEMFLAFGGWLAGVFTAGAIAALISATMAEAGDVAIAATACAIGVVFILAGIFVGRTRAAPKTISEFSRHFAVSLITGGLTAATIGMWYLIYQLIEATTVAGAETSHAMALAGLIVCIAMAIGGVFITRFVKDNILTFLITFFAYGVLIVSLGEISTINAIFNRLAIFLMPGTMAAGYMLFTTPVRNRVYSVVGSALLIAPLVWATVYINVGVISSSLFHNNGGISFWAYGALIAVALWRLRNTYTHTGLVATGLLLLAALWFLPQGASLAIILLVAGITGNHRGLTAIAITALVWFIGWFYYDLSMTLLEKSALMMGLGVATLAGVAILSYMPANRGGSRDGSRKHSDKSGAHTGNRASRAAFLSLGFLLITGLSLARINYSVWQLETALPADARTLYLPLAPRDPRSLLQGDYMVLNFSAGIYPPTDTIITLPRNGQVVLKLDESDVATFARVPGPELTSQSLASHEVIITYQKTDNTHLTYVPASFFFQEGDAPVYAAARFAVVRVSLKGNAQLVGLADEARLVLGPALRLPQTGL